MATKKKDSHYNNYIMWCVNCNLRFKEIVPQNSDVMMNSWHTYVRASSDEHSHWWTFIAMCIRQDNPLKYWICSMYFQLRTQVRSCKRKLVWSLNQLRFHFISVWFTFFQCFLYCQCTVQWPCQGTLCCMVILYWLLIKHRLSFNNFSKDYSVS